MSQAFLSTLAKASGKCKDIDFSKKTGWFPDDGKYNVLLSAFEIKENAGTNKESGEAFHVATPHYTIIDGPMAGKTMKPGMFFQDSDSEAAEPTFGQKALCTLATVIRGDECYDAVQAFDVVQIAANQRDTKLEVLVKRAINPKTGENYDRPSVYVNRRIS